MWSINLFMNKVLKAVEENLGESAENRCNFFDSYTIQQSANKDQRSSVSSHFVEVPHINQQNTWDCGLACVLMVLRALGVYGCSIQELVELCCTTSIWTVDLAYLLQKFSVSFTYCTVTLGANPDFSVETYYKDQLSSDLVRVNMLFQEARKAGIDIECRSVSAKDISDFILSGKYVAIALVDQHKLRPVIFPNRLFLKCDLQTHFNPPKEFQTYLWPFSFFSFHVSGITNARPSVSQSQLEDVCVSDYYSDYPGYTGHYVVICGYDAATNEFEIRDPASSRKHERVPLWCFEQAHKSFGTDEDFLLISLERAGGQGI